MNRIIRAQRWNSTSPERRCKSLKTARRQSLMKAKTRSTAVPLWEKGQETPDVIFKASKMAFTSCVEICVSKTSLSGLP